LGILESAVHRRLAAAGLVIALTLGHLVLGLRGPRHPLNAAARVTLSLSCLHGDPPHMAEPYQFINWIWVASIVMIAMTRRSQSAIRGFFGFPAGSLPGFRLLPNFVLNSLIARKFSMWGELRKKFSLSFPMRQGKRQRYPAGLRPSLAVAIGLCESFRGAQSTAMARRSDLKLETIEAGIGLDYDRASESLLERA
jgi:hypothetical protein